MRTKNKKVLTRKYVCPTKKSDNVSTYKLPRPKNNKHYTFCETIEHIQQSNIYVK